MRLLLVEDDRKIAPFLLRGLRAAGFAVDHAEDGVRGLDLALGESYDVAVVDVMLPGMNGIDLVRRVREEKSRMPVIILSARGEVKDRIRGLESGADDYLSKPFSFSELLARIQALLRRSRGGREPTRLEVADLRMDLIERSVYRGGTRISLPPLEFSLLEYLLRSAGRVVSKIMIMEHVWDYHFDPGSNVVEARISRLRDKVDKGFSPRLIHTVRGMGYVLREEE